MVKRLKLGIYSEEQTTTLIRHMLDRLEQQCEHDMDTEYFKRREELLYRMHKIHFDLVLVAYSGALGMEAAIGVRDISPHVPLIWVSDQQEFVPQSYRLHTTAFMLMPPDPLQLSHILANCLGISLRNEETQKEEA